MIKSLKEVCKGSISDERKDFMKSIEVINFHQHIGNILERDDFQIYQKGIEFPIDERTLGGRLGFKAPGIITKALLNMSVIDNILKESGKKRNASATLENFSKSLDESYVLKAVCLPIPPAQTLDDLIQAKNFDDRIIPFTGVDFSKNLNYYELDTQFKLDILNGAKGLKIHPIIQAKRATSKEINSVVEIWKQHDLPIIFHTGITEYARKDENIHHVPEFGKIDDFVELSRNHSDAKIVIGHSGLFDVDKVLELLPEFQNVSVDTSFQGVEKIRELHNKFGSERLHWASDWPYGDTLPAVNVMFDALGDDEDVLKKVMSTNSLYSMKMK